MKFLQFYLVLLGDWLQVPLGEGVLVLVRRRIRGQGHVDEVCPARFVHEYELIHGVDFVGLLILVKYEFLETEKENVKRLAKVKKTPSFTFMRFFPFMRQSFR